MERARRGEQRRESRPERSPEDAEDFLSENEATGGPPHRTYQQILVGEIVHGLGELERPTNGLLLSGLSAGLDIGLGVLLIATAATLGAGQLSDVAMELLLANFYAVGFIFVVVGRSELFTEHTTLAVFPLLEGSARVRTVARLWGLVYVSNLVGAAAIAALIVAVGPALGTIEPAVLGELAHHMTDHPAGTIALSALLAGWLMGLMSWLATAARETVSQVLLVWLVAASIGLAGLHHCIVGSVEVIAGLLADPTISVADYGHFLLWTTLGNAVGGVVFVALVKFGHAVRPGSEPTPGGVVPESEEEPEGTD